ncbi:MAG: hypothetical protein HOK75_07515 [Phycisphaerae bacterium]|nr:hypothetical protein [Phycisphaerae bacterium]
MKIRIYIYSFIIALLTSCGSMGPKSIRAGRMEYNLALGQSDSEQLLLNIVKMRFLDRAVFLNVTSMTSNLSFQSEISTTTTGIFDSVAFPTSANPSFTWKDNPTITYEELTGVEYVTQMLSPIPVDTIVLLLQSWPASMVLPLALNEINDVNNDWNPINPTISSTASVQHKKFNEITEAIQFLDAQRTLEWSVIRTDAENTHAIETAILLNNHPGDKTEETIALLLSSLGLAKSKEGNTKFSIEYGLEAKDDSTLVLGTRSMQDILTYASLDIDIPSELADQALINTHPKDAEVEDKLLHIRTSLYRPRNASVAVEYHGAWFYVQADDLQSKATFLLIQMLMGMQSGASSSGAPVLTIPISS